MPQYGIDALQAGVRSLGGLANLGTTRAQAYEQALTQGATGRLRLAQARKTGEEALGAQMANEALRGLEGSLGPLVGAMGFPSEIPLPAGQAGPPAPAPDYTSSIANVLRAGGGNAAQLADALRTLGAGAREQRAVDTFPQDRELANVMLEAAGRRAYTPFGTNAQGITTNKATGEVDLGNEMAQQALQAMQALTSQRGAAAGASSALAAQRRAQMDPTNPITAARLALTQAQTGAANARAANGGGKPLMQERKLAELIADGVDPDLAEGIAYGTFKVIKDPMGFGAKIIDYRTMGAVADIDEDGNITRLGGAPMGSPGAATGASGGAATGLPTPGDVVDGYRFIGGDPNKPASWAPAQ